MKLKFDETGLVEGGIRCRFATLETVASPESENVFDLVDWVNKRFSELQILAKDAGKKRAKAEGIIWLGETIYPFARLFASRSTYSVWYFHPQYTREQGWHTMPEEFESNNLDKVVNQIIAKARRVKNLDEERQFAPLDAFTDPILRLIIDTARRNA